VTEDPNAPLGVDVRLLPAAAAAWGAGWWATGARVVGPVRAAAVAVLIAGTGSVAALALAGARGEGTRSPAGPLRASPGWRRSASATALTAAAAGAVLASAAGSLAVREAGAWPGWVRDRAVATIEGTLVSDPVRVADRAASSSAVPPPSRTPPARWVLRLDAARVTARGITQLVDLPVLVLGGPGWQGLSAGQQVRLSGRLAVPDPGEEPAALVTAVGAPLAVVEGAWPWRLADAVRASLRRACEGLPERAGGLLPSLVDGDTSRLPDALRADLMAAGLSHLTAVSGANLAIMAQSALWVAGALRWPRVVRLTLLALTLLGFVVLARPSPSVLRAAGMGAVAVAATAASRRPRAVPALAAALVALLVMDPWLARSPGFVLSAVATGGLLLLAPRWADSLSRHVPRPLALALAAPAAAQVACGPVLVLLQPSLSLVAVPANLVAEPAVAPATVAGVVAALTGTVSSPLAHAVAVGGALGTGWIALVAERAARLPLAAVPWPGGPAGALLLALAEAGLVALTLPVARRAVHAFLRGRTRALVTASALASVPAVVWSAGLRPPLLGPGPAAPGWAVVMCDVGQGDATVLRSGPDRAVLVDAGPDPALADGCLRRLGVRHLDLVVLTHFHADHVGGLLGALAGRDAGGVLVSPLGQPSDNAAAVLRQAATARADLTVAALGGSGRASTYPWAVDWRVVAASATTGAGEEGDDGTVVNEASVALDVIVRGPAGSLHAVLLGDLETSGQEQLAARLRGGSEHLDGAIDVVKVAHHGSAKQSEDLYRRIQARVGLIGVGAGNDYGHPAPSALALLRRTGTLAARTDVSGDLAVAPGAAGALVVTTSR
jgi:competence protein ComEC